MPLWAATQCQSTHVCSLRGVLLHTLPASFEVVPFVLVVQRSGLSKNATAHHPLQLCVRASRRPWCVLFVKGAVQVYNSLWYCTWVLSAVYFWRWAPAVPEFADPVRQWALPCEVALAGLVAFVAQKACHGVAEARGSVLA